MADVTFNEESSPLPSRAGVQKARGLAASLVRAGIAKNEDVANVILLAVAALIVVVAGYFFFAGQATRPAPTEEDRAEFEALKRNGLSR